MQALDFTTKLVLADALSKESNVPVPDDDKAGCSNYRSACGFDFWLKAERFPSAVGDILEVDIYSEPASSCDDYQLIVDYKLTLSTSNDEIADGNSRRQCASVYVQFEPIAKGYSKREESDRRPLRIGWQDALDLGYLTADSENTHDHVCTARLQLLVRDLIKAHREDYSQESPPRRDFSLILEHQKEVYVNLQYLADQGSEYFRDLLESKRKGVRRAVAMNVEAPEMEIFLDAVCTHRKAVITNRNFDVVLRLAQEFGVDKILRACEAYLIQAETVHPIRKLEYAAEYGLGLLGETVVRRLNDAQPFAALDALHEYLQLNNERLDQMHPDVLSSLNVFEQYVVM